MRIAQQERLRFIGEKLARDGRINRADLTDRYGIHVNQATTDLKRFMDLNPKAMTYSGRARCYVARGHTVPADRIPSRLISISDADWEIALRLGKGNASAGIRRALRSATNVAQ